MMKPLGKTLYLRDYRMIRNINALLSNFIKEKIKEKKTTQVAIRKRILRHGKYGVSSGTMSEILSGKNDIYVDYAIQIFDILGINVLWDSNGFREIRETIIDKDLVLGKIDSLRKDLDKQMSPKRKRKTPKQSCKTCTFHELKKRGGKQ